MANELRKHPYYVLSETKAADIIEALEAAGVDDNFIPYCKLIEMYHDSNMNHPCTISMNVETALTFMDQIWCHQKEYENCKPFPEDLSIFRDMTIDDDFVMMCYLLWKAFDNGWVENADEWCLHPQYDTWRDFCLWFFENQELWYRAIAKLDGADPLDLVTVDFQYAYRYFGKGTYEC